MTDDDERSRKIVQSLRERLDGLEIEVIGGLVKNQARGFLEKHLPQSHARALASRQNAHGLPDGVAREKKRPGEVEDVLPNDRRVRLALQRLLHGVVGQQLLRHVLREIGDRDLVARLDPATQGW